MVVPSSRGGVPVFSRPSAKPNRSSVSGQADRRRLPDPAGRRLPFADMDQPAQKCAGGQHHGAGRELAAVRESEPGGPAARHDQVVGLALDHRQIGGGGDRLLHGGGIELAVGLGARSAHRRTLAAVEHPELDAAAVGDPAHQAVERVDLADQMALAEPADGRIARHRADGRELVGHQRSRRAHARGRGRGLTAGVAAADDDDVEPRLHLGFSEGHERVHARLHRARAY